MPCSTLNKDKAYIFICLMDDLRLDMISCKLLNGLSQLVIEVQVC